MGMNTNGLKGPYLMRTNSVAFGAGQAQQIQLQQSLSQAAAMLGRDCLITFAWIEYTVSVSTTALGAGAHLPQLATRLQINDMGGERCDMSGAGLRILGKWEAGEMARDPSGLAASQGATTVNYAFPLWALFPWFRAAVPMEFAIPIADWTKGVDCNLTWCGATFGKTGSWAIASGSARLVLECWANPQGKRNMIPDGSRLHVKEVALQAGVTTQALDIKGRLRASVIYAGQAIENTGTTPFVTTNYVINTPELMQTALPVWLQSPSRFDRTQPITQVRDATTQVVTTENPFDQQWAFPLYEVTAGATVGDAPLLDDINPAFTGLTFLAGNTHLRSTIDRHHECATREAGAQATDPATGLVIPAAQIPSSVRPFISLNRPIRKPGC